MEIEQIYGDLPALETDRLLLRKITIEDLEGMYSYASNQVVAKYVTWNAHQFISDTKEFVEFVLSQYENRKIAPWGIEYKETGNFIGTIDFVSWLPHHNTAEIGYVIHPHYWGRGITTEAAKRVISFGFEKMDLVRIQARCLIENIGSARVMEKSGMTFEGILRKAIFIKEQHQDLKMYSIIKEEFLSSERSKSRE